MVNYSNVDELNNYLATRSYISGYKFSSEDVKVLSGMKTFPNAASHPYAARWAKHISALSGSSLSAPVASACTAKAAAPAKVAAAPTKPAAKPAATKAANDDTFDDMFGDDDEPAPVKPAAAVDDKMDNMFDDDGETEEERAANKARHERMETARKLKEAKDLAEGKKKSVKAVEKSLIVLDVKPWEANTDLKALWETIIQYKQDGLTWGESFKLEPVAYGIMKLVMTVSIEDAKVLLDDITDNIEAIEEFVQSVTVASMNKI